MTRPTVAQAEAWRPDALRRTADDWDAAAADLQARVDAVVPGIDGSRDFWTGPPPMRPAVMARRSPRAVRWRRAA